MGTSCIFGSSTAWSSTGRPVRIGRSVLVIACCPLDASDVLSFEWSGCRAINGRRCGCAAKRCWRSPRGSTGWRGTRAASRPRRPTRARDLDAAGRQVQGGAPVLPRPRAGRVVDGGLGPGLPAVEGDVDAGDAAALPGEGVAGDGDGTGGQAGAVVGGEDRGGHRQRPQRDAPTGGGGGVGRQQPVGRGISLGPGPAAASGVDDEVDQEPGRRAVRCRASGVRPGGGPDAARRGFTCSQRQGQRGAPARRPSVSDRLCTRSSIS